jgi:transcriptional regulator with XRE-family HTH domain
VRNALFAVIRLLLKPKGHTRHKYKHIDVVVGTNLRTIRTSLGYSQAALAYELGITFQQVQKYERGENRISSSVLYTLSNFLNVPIASFFDGLDEPGEPKSAPQTKMATSEMRLLADYRKLSPELKAQARAVVKTLSR